MTNTKINRLIYRVKHDYLTMNNIVVIVAFAIAASWAWGSIGVLQKNYDLQKVVDDKKRQAQLIELETQNLQYEQKYLKSAEYQELALRERTGVAKPGERVLVLPPNTDAAKAADAHSESTSSSTASTATQPSNVQQWMDFLFGGGATS